MDDDDVKLGAWVGACCIFGALAVVLVAMAVRGRA